MAITLTILVLTVGLFIWGRIRSDLVALSALCALLLTGILTPSEALAGFSSPIVAMMTGLFVIGGAILQTGLASAAGNWLVRLAKGNETLTFLLVMISTAVIGAFVSNTGTVALMMPIIVSISAKAGFSSSRMLMPLAFAGSLGGMLTLIGTPPNLVIDEILETHGYESLQFFSFLPVGIVCIAIGIIVLLPLSRLFLTKRTPADAAAQGSKSPSHLVEEYQLAGLLFKCRIRSSCSLCGHTVRELNLMQRYGVSIIEIRNERKSHMGLIHDVSQSMAWSDSRLQEGDIVYLLGRETDIDKLAKDTNLELQDQGHLDFYELGLAEIVILPESRMERLRIRDSRLREQYHLNVLGIRRGGTYLTSGLGDCRLHNGDVLLIQGQWNDILQLHGETGDWVVLGRPERAAEKVTLDFKAPIAAAIMLAMIVLMVFDIIPIAPVTAVILAALAVVFAGCFRNVEAAYRTINWESIMLIAAMMPMSTALEKTGVSSLVSQTLVSVLGGYGPTALLAGLYLTTSILTFFISNTATAVLMAPIALVAAEETGVSPYAFLFAVTLGASMCFASPFSTPPNALVMKAGNYSFRDYVKVGLPLQIAIGIVMTFLLPVLFPYGG